MSATKQLLEQQHNFEQHDFVTDDSYEDFLRMQKEHEQSLEFEKLEEEFQIQHSPKMHIDWSEQANDFLNKQETDLPF